MPDALPETAFVDSFCPGFKPPHGCGPAGCSCADVYGERSRIVAHLHKWHGIRESSPIARRWESIFDGIEKGEHDERGD